MGSATYITMALAFFVSQSLSQYHLAVCPETEKCFTKEDCDSRCSVCPQKYRANLTTGMCLNEHCLCDLYDMDIYPSIEFKVPITCLDDKDEDECDKLCKSTCLPSCEPYGRCLLEICSCGWSKVNE